MLGSRPILVADDNADLRAALSRILRTEGHEVIEASDGLSALAKFKEYSPRMVLLAGNMRGMDGEMVLETIQRETPHQPTPAVLMASSETQQERAQEMGGVTGLCKPFRVEDLLRAIDETPWVPAPRHATTRTRFRESTVFRESATAARL